MCQHIKIYHYYEHELDLKRIRSVLFVTLSSFQQTFFTLLKGLAISKAGCCNNWTM